MRLRASVISALYDKSLLLKSEVVGGSCNADVLSLVRIFVGCQSKLLLMHNCILDSLEGLERRRTVHIGRQLW